MLRHINEFPEGTAFKSLRAQDIDGFQLEPGDVLPVSLPVLNNQTILRRLVRAGYIEPIVEIQTQTPFLDNSATFSPATPKPKTKRRP